jgi:hypothetical protein
MNEIELEKAIQSAYPKQSKHRKTLKQRKCKKKILNFIQFGRRVKLLNCCRTTIYNWCKARTIRLQKNWQEGNFQQNRFGKCRVSSLNRKNRMNLTINGGKNAR